MKKEVLIEAINASVQSSEHITINRCVDNGLDLVRQCTDPAAASKLQEIQMKSEANYRLFLKDRVLFAFYLLPFSADKMFLITARCDCNTADGAIPKRAEDLIHKAMVSARERYHQLSGQQF